MPNAKIYDPRFAEPDDRLEAYALANQLDGILIWEDELPDPHVLATGGDGHPPPRLRIRGMSGGS